MEEIYQAIIEIIQNEMPEIVYVDEDYGQLEALDAEGSDNYPVLFPCVLIGNVNADWEDIGMGAQTGNIELTVRLGIDCYHDTHAGSGTTGRVSERLAMNNRLFRALQCRQFNRDMDGMARIKSRDYTLTGNIKVYETVFSFSYHDESALLSNRRRRQTD